MSAEIVSLAAWREQAWARQVLARQAWLASLEVGDRVRVQGRRGTWTVLGEPRPNRVHLLQQGTAVVTYAAPEDLWPADEEQRR